MLRSSQGGLRAGPCGSPQLGTRCIGRRRLERRKPAPWRLAHR